MPNIIYKWDFEDGTTQGWALAADVNLDDSGAVQGTYSLHRSGCGDVASISNVDLTSTTKPLLILTVRHIHADTSYYETNAVQITITETGTTNTLVQSLQRLHDANLQSDYYKIYVFDISNAAGKNVDIKVTIYAFGTCSASYSDTYVDNIVIIDGADYEYTVAILGNNNEDKTITIDVPDSDISTLSANAMALSLATPPWFSETGDTIQFTAINDQGQLSLLNTDSSGNPYRHANLAIYSNTLTSFSQAQIYIRPINYTDNTHYNEEVAVVFADSGFNYKAVYLFDLYFTINPISPKFATVLHTTTYGNTVSGQKDYTININANSLDVAFKVSYLVGDSSLVQTGSVTMEVWDSSLTTQYGTAQVDLTTSNSITSSYVTGVPTNTNVVLRFKWSLTATARVVLMVTPIFRVS